MRVNLPNILATDELVHGNRVRQVAALGLVLDGDLATFKRGRVEGSLFRPSAGGDEILVVPKGRDIPTAYTTVLQAVVDPVNGQADLSHGSWLRHPLLTAGSARTAVDHERERQNVLDSWAGAFAYVQDNPGQGILGLRPPQIGAVHAVHAHWSVSDAPATVVMPTGTGKTDTMISLLVSTPCPRLLIVVPTDALRIQLAEKFLTLGILRASGSTILDVRARYPVVGILEHIPRSPAEVDDLFDRCHVIVTTSSIAGQSDQAVQERMAHHCPYLFIDEVHHAEAPTWSTFKTRFQSRRVVQFTATPFREDGKPLDGDIVYRYPLRKAQQDGYFRPITFSPVVEFNLARADAAIAAQAIGQLRKDAHQGHVLMARVDSVERAKQVFELYRPYAEFNPVQLHTGIKSHRERMLARRQILSGTARIIVCVDMLGEGFDLPTLKIAAFHDIRKSLAVTLQLAGRFTRARPDLGDATFIANVADINVQDELRKLYTRDPDWNLLLPEISDRLIGEQVSLQDFLRGFTSFPDAIPLKTVQPAMSTVVYKTTCAPWSPENYAAGVPGLAGCEQVHHAVNTQEHTLVIVTAKRVLLPWTDLETVFGWEWELYVLIWSQAQNLLFINTSTNSGDYRALAKAVAGDDVVLVTGQPVFRTFAGVHRLRLQNVGLTEQLGRNVRYTGRMGADVEPALTDMQKRRARKAVLFGIGYEGGQKVSVGASRKGRIWSHRRQHVDALAAWCKSIGTKLLDETIDPDEVLKGTLEARAIPERPPLMPIGIDWPEEFYKSPEATWWIEFDGRNYPVGELSIELVEPSADGPLRLALAAETNRVELALELFQLDDSLNYRFSVRGKGRALVRHGEHAEAVDIADYFYEEPPIIWFVDGSSLEGNEHVALKGRHPPYDPDKIQAWDWSGINLRRESQGAQKDPASIQARVLRELKSRDYAVIVDDDGKGEAADIVAIRLTGDSARPSSIEVEFYHCKFSHADTPGQRLDDLYEVCGQAQKSVSWMYSVDRQTDLFTHLLRREAHRHEAGVASRFEVGDDERLLAIREMSRVLPLSLSIYIVQPGVSRSRVTSEQLTLLSVTETYLMETYQLPLAVIASP